VGHYRVGLLVELDLLDHRAVIDTQHPTPYLDTQHPVLLLHPKPSDSPET